MDANRIVLRVIASPRFVGVVVLAFAAVCMAALDVPQGLPDPVVLESWSHGIGPFITLLGLNHLGRGLLPWALLGALASHAIAARLPAGLTRSEMFAKLAGHTKGSAGLVALFGQAQ